MSLIGTPEHRGNTLLVLGVDAPGAGLPTIELDDVSRFNVFSFLCVTGAVTVRASLNGTDFSAADLAWEDEQSTNPNTRVTALTAGNLYRFIGNLKSIRILQTGATGIVSAVLMAGTAGRD